MTDTVMGNTLGYFTIQVEPFSTEPENIVVRTMRLLERWAVPLFSDAKGTEHEALKILKAQDKVKELLI